MKTVLKIKILADTEQHEALKSTMLLFNTVCNKFSDEAFRHSQFSKRELQELVYHPAKIWFEGFSSQLLIRAVDKVSCSYKYNPTQQTFFRKYGAVIYDERCLTFKSSVEISIWTTAGRIKIPIHVHNKEKFKRVKGQCDLIIENNVFYLIAVVHNEDVKPYTPLEWLGVDLGIVNIATDSTGETFSGVQIEKVRQKHHTLRQSLQKKGTRSAKRHIRKTKGKESRFRKNVNHCISKKLVAKAKGTHSGIVLEELSGIRSRVTVRKSQRAKHSSWAFAQLRQFVTYKGKLQGVPVEADNPAYSSRTCWICFYCDKKNRKSQSEFCCLNCGNQENADINAAKVLSQRDRRANINKPIVTGSLTV